MYFFTLPKCKDVNVNSDRLLYNTRSILKRTTSQNRSTR